MASHTKKRTQVSSGRLIIRTRQQTMEMIGVSGTQGTRKPRGLFGCFLRSTSTPKETTMNANKVPMFERSENQLISKIPAGTPTRIPASQVLTCGVWKRG